MALAEDRLTARPSGRAADQALRAPRRAGGTMLSGAPTWAWALAAVLILLPLLVSGFVLNSIFSYSFILGMIGLSLMFLGGYGGMVSLTQMTVAGLAAYMTAIFGPSAIETISLGWPWYLTIPTAIVIATAFGTLAGLLAVRTEGIYTIMITLAIAAGMFNFTLQNYTIFNGFSGFNGVLPPPLFGVDWTADTPFYYLCLIAAFLGGWGVLYVSRSPFGLALQGVRDNPRRMAALGFGVNAHRVAAYAFASVIASIAGILLVWQSNQIVPGTAGIGAVIDILVIAVVGGMGHPIGPFIGALIYVILRTFALDALVAVGLDGERFRLLVGLGFLAIVYFSPDGVLGLRKRWLDSRGKDPLTGEREDGA
ncbi:MAG: branched-chain amino acid ABC transporter permease [Pseudomonadota bacterium]